MGFDLDFDNLLTLAQRYGQAFSVAAPIVGTARKSAMASLDDDNRNETVAF